VSWLWQVSGEAGSGDLARPSWLCEFLQKENAKRKVRPSAAKCVNKNKNGFWAAPALVSLTWQAKLEISMLPKHQFFTAENDFLFFKHQLFTMNSTPRH